MPVEQVFPDQIEKINRTAPGPMETMAKLSGKEQLAGSLAALYGVQHLLIGNMRRELSIIDQSSLDPELNAAYCAGINNFIDVLRKDLIKTGAALWQLSQGRAVQMPALAEEKYADYERRLEIAQLLLTSGERFTVYADKARTAGANQLADAIGSYRTRFSKLAIEALGGKTEDVFFANVQKAYGNAWMAVGAVSFEPSNASWGYFAQADFAYFETVAGRRKKSGDIDSAYVNIRDMENYAVASLMEYRPGLFDFLTVRTERDFLRSVAKTTAFTMQEITGERDEDAVDARTEIVALADKLFRRLNITQFLDTVTVHSAKGIAPVFVPIIGAVYALETIVKAHGNLSSTEWAKVAVMATVGSVAQFSTLFRVGSLTTASRAARGRVETGMAVGNAFMAAELTAGITGAASGIHDIATGLSEKGLKDPETAVMAIQQLFSAGVLLGHAAPNAKEAGKRIYTKASLAASKARAAAKRTYREEKKGVNLAIGLGELDAATKAAWEGLIEFGISFVKLSHPDDSTSNKIVAVLETHRELLARDQQLFYRIVDDFSNLTKQFVEKFASLPYAIQRFILATSKSSAGITLLLQKAEMIDNATEKYGIPLTELDYRNDPRVLNKTDRDITNAINAGIASRSKTLGDIVLISNKYKDELTTGRNPVFSNFNSVITGIADAFSKHGDNPLLKFKHPGVHYIVGTVFGVDLVNGNRALFYIDKKKIHVIYIGDHKGYDIEVNAVRKQLGSSGSRVGNIKKRYEDTGFAAAP